jgi:hypothetical protein
MRRYKILLMELENLFSALLDCEDANKQLQILPKTHSGQLEELYKARLAELSGYFQHSRLVQYLSVHKGRILLARLLALLPRAEVVKLVRALFVNLPGVLKRDSGKEYVTILAQPFMSAISRLHGPDFGELVRTLSIDNWDAAVSNPMMYQVLFRMVKHSACLPDFASSENWQSMVRHWAEAICKRVDLEPADASDQAVFLSLSSADPSSGSDANGLGDGVCPGVTLPRATCGSASATGDTVTNGDCSPMICGNKDNSSTRGKDTVPTSSSAKAAATSSLPPLLDARTLCVRDVKMLSGFWQKLGLTDTVIVRLQTLLPRFSSDDVSSLPS